MASSIRLPTAGASYRLTAMLSGSGAGFSMGLILIAVVLISGGSSAQVQSGLMKIALRLVAPAAKALTDAAETETKKEKEK